MTAPHFRPVHDAHAIVEEMIFFEFSPNLEQAMPALITLKDELKDDLPEHDVINVMKVQFKQQDKGAPEVGSAEVNKAAGLRLSRFQVDGKIDTLVSIEQNSIGVFCYHYTGWNNVWPKHRKYVSRIFSKIIGTSFMTGVGMRWTDQFIYEGEESAYDAHLLLKPGSVCLHPRAFGSGSRWHCHTGWFDTDTSRDREVLNQLNLDAGLVNEAGAMRTAVTIAHTQVIRATQALDQLADLVPGHGDGLDALSGLMGALHDGNKRVLRDLLTESSLERIGLGAG